MVWATQLLLAGYVLYLVDAPMWLWIVWVALCGYPVVRIIEFLRRRQGRHKTTFTK